MKIVTYPDLGKYVINDKNETSLTYRINSYEDLFLLKSIKDANPNLKEITIPCMFQQQHDKRFNSNESFELKLVCEFINSIGFEKVKVFHPHSDVTLALLNNCEVIDNSKFIKVVINDILPKQAYNESGKFIDYAIEEGDYVKNTPENLILLSADAGGFKGLFKLADIIEWQGETSSASKSRDPKTHKLTQLVDRQDFGGKNILIVDDICVYGGTFKGLSKLLKERNCGKLYLAISHITVQNLGEDPITNYYDKVFTTNSKYDTYNWGNCIGNGNPKNLQILNLF